MSKTPATKPSGADDSSQQPTQKTTPTPRENGAIEKEDHVKKRDKLSEGEQRK
jgi:hypothetical protein